MPLSLTRSRWIATLNLLLALSLALTTGLISTPAQAQQTCEALFVKAAEQAAQAAWTVANNRYRGGLATYLDVLAAEDSLISTRRTAAVLQTRAFSLDVALVRALGGGFRS